MSHKYQVHLNYPENFELTIKNFTREVLRNQPKNIYEYGLEYFTNLANMEQRHGQDMLEMSEERVEGMVTNQNAHVREATPDQQRATVNVSRSEIPHEDDEHSEERVMSKEDAPSSNNEEPQPIGYGEEDVQEHQTPSNEVEEGGDGDDDGEEIEQQEIADNGEIESHEQLVELLLNHSSGIKAEEPYSIIKNTQEAIRTVVPQTSPMQTLFVLSYFSERYESLEPRDGYSAFVTEIVGPLLFDCLTHSIFGGEMEVDLESEMIKDMPAPEFQNEIRIVLDQSGFVSDGIISNLDLRRTLQEADVDFSEKEIAVIVAGSEEGDLSVDSLVQSIPVLCYCASQFDLFDERSRAQAQQEQPQE